MRSRVTLGVPWGGHLEALSVRMASNWMVLHVKEIDGLQSSEHHGETLDVSNHFGPGQPGEGVEAHEVESAMVSRLR